MKINLLFTLLLLLFCTAVFSQNTYVPDDNFEQALIDLGLDSGELDDLVPTAAIDTVKILNIPEKNISDLTGIEAFTSIVEFRCYSNNIFELDFSNNVLLEVLYCGKNPASTINLSNNIELRLLNFNEGHITEIDLSYNVKLEKIYCGKNNLTQLDVSNNPELFRLYCEENQLNTLNVSNNPKLQQLRAFQNDLTNIDLSSCMSLTDIQLYDNNITAIDFSYNTNLHDISVSYNQLTEIDVSNCPKLENLEFEGNSVSAIDVSNCPKLERLTCSKNEIISLDIRNNPVLRNLFARDNQLSELNLKNGNIEGLDRMTALNNPNLICIDVEDVEAANSKQSLKWLIDETANYSEDCGNFTEQLTYIPDDNFEQALIDQGYDSGELDDSILTGVVQNIVNLSIPNRNISDLTGIEDFTSLEELNCSRNNISSFIELPFLINLKELQIQENQLENLNILSNTELERVFCGLNQITSLNLGNNTKLEDLQCQMNPISSLDLHANVNLKRLFCFSTLITELNLESNPELEILSCNGTQISDIQFSESSKLKSVSCKGTNLTSLDVSGLDSLEYLLISDNELVSLDLSNNTKMSYLDCRNNNLSELNLKNGNINGFEEMYATNNSNLSCIEVDDVVVANAKDADNWEKDNTAVYSENCGTYVTPMTYVPDDNFEQALIDLGWDSGELDDSVATIQISQLTNLYIRDKGIADLTGIEDFVALEYFYLDGNELTELPIQNNINLINLSCSSNQLTTIKLQNLVRLEVLHCNSNLLTAIDVSVNPELKNLSCGENPIEILNLENNPKLEELYCSYTEISSIHFPQNSKLERLSCESSKLLDVDVSMLDSMNYISVYNNELTSLDLSNNLKIEEIYCGDNQIDIISLPENDLLRKIGCQQNQISNIQEIGSAPVLANLTYLNVQYNNFVFADFEPNWEQLTQIENFNYYPQNWIGIETDTTVAEGAAFHLEIAGYTPGENDLYTWYKNQTIMEEEVDEVLLFDTVEHSDSGRYYCEINNSLIPNLTLRMYQTMLHISTPLGIDDERNNRIKIYPNPATDIVYVETGLESSSLRILNQAGNVLRVFKNFTDSPLDVSFLNHGVYYIHITNKNESIALKLLIK